jgi:hypothetical protein
MADTLTLTYPPHSGSWVLHPPSDPYGDGYVLLMPVELHDDGLGARHTIDLDWPNAGPPDLASYFKDLADHWRGWHGDRTWRSLDGSMVIKAAHDGQGLVTLAGTLTHGVVVPTRWMARVCFTIEAGEQMRSLAADVEAHFTDVTR